MNEWDLVQNMASTKGMCQAKSKLDAVAEHILHFHMSVGPYMWAGHESQSCMSGIAGLGLC